MESNKELFERENVLANNPPVLGNRNGSFKRHTDPLSVIVPYHCSHPIKESSDVLNMLNATPGKTLADLETQMRQRREYASKHRSLSSWCRLAGIGLFVASAGAVAVTATAYQRSFSGGL